MPTYSPYGVPGQVNGITNFFNWGCADPGYVWVVTAAQAALTVFASATKGSWKQAIEYGTGESWIKNLRAVAHDLDQPGDPISSDGLNHLFKIAAKLDTAVWASWVAGLGVDFAMDWKSANTKLAACGEAGAMGNMFSGNQATGGIAAPGIAACPLYVGTGRYGGTVGVPYVLAPYDGLASMFFSFECTVFGSGSVQIGGIIMRNGTEPVVVGNLVGEGAGQANHSVMCSAVGVPLNEGETLSAWIQLASREGFVTVVIFSGGACGSDFQAAPDLATGTDSGGAT